jgi:hypothetical protein
MMRRSLVLLLTLPSLAYAGYEASSFKREDKLGKNYWNAASALDAKMDTCWMMEPEQDNVGQWLAIDVPAGTEVDKLGAVIGWAKNDESFKDFGRLKTVTVEIFNMVGTASTQLATAEVSFEDKTGWQILDLPDTKIPGEGTGGRIKVTVKAFYPGVDFPHLAVSELRVQLKEFDAATFELSRPFDSEVEANPGSDAVDANPKTFWAASGPTANFAVRAKGFGMSSLVITNGPKTHARPKVVEVTANQSTITYTLDDKPTATQSIILPYLSGYTGGAWGEVNVKILESYPGDVATNGVAIAELKVMAGSVEEF